MQARRRLWVTAGAGIHASSPHTHTHRAHTRLQSSTVFIIAWKWKCKHTYRLRSAHSGTSGTRGVSVVEVGCYCCSCCCCQNINNLPAIYVSATWWFVISPQQSFEYIYSGLIYIFITYNIYIPVCSYVNLEMHRLAFSVTFSAVLPWILFINAHVARIFDQFRIFRCAI